MHFALFLFEFVNVIVTIRTNEFIQVAFRIEACFGSTHFQHGHEFIGKLFKYSILRIKI